MHDFLLEQALSEIPEYQSAFAQLLAESQSAPPLLVDYAPLEEEPAQQQKAEEPALPPKATVWDKAKNAPSFLTEEDQEFEGLAKDLLVRGAVTLLAAPRGLGKTLFAHCLAVILALGGLFRGQDVRSVKVILVDRDNPKSVIRKRLRGWGASAAENLHILTREDAPDLRDKKAWCSFPVDNYDVLIIDSVGSSTEGVSEKEGKETTQILEAVEKPEKET